MIADAQLALFDDSDVRDAPAREPAPRESNGRVAIDADLIAAVRELVAEPDMTAVEVEAVVADALAEMGWHPHAPLRAQPCRCLRRLVLRPGPECYWCGRSPHAVGGPRYVEPVETRYANARKRSVSRRCRECGEPLAWSGREWICDAIMCSLAEASQ